LTALEVAKPEYLDVFGLGNARPASALSNRTIRPVDSFASINSVYLGSPTDSSSVYSTDRYFDIDSVIHQFLTSLRITSPSVYHRTNFEHINYLKTSLAEATHQCDQIVQHFRDRINEATRVVSDLKTNVDKIDALRDVVVVATKGKLILRSISPKKRNRDSEDSDMTIVSLSDIAGSQTIPCHTSTATQTVLIDHFLVHMPPIPSSAQTWLDRFIQSSDSTTCKTYINGLREAEWESPESPKRDGALSPPPPSKIAFRFKQLAKKKRKLEEKIFDLQLEAGVGKNLSSGTSRVKAWLKRMVVPAHSPRKLEIVFDIDEKNCIVGREVKHLQAPQATWGDAIDASIDNALKTSQVVLEAVKRDLQSINKSLVAAEQFINMANYSVSRVHRVVRRAIKKRQSMIDDLQASLKENASADSRRSLSPPTSYPNSSSDYNNILSSRPSLSSITTIHSNRSSVISVAATLTEHADDEDTRIIRRLLLRKIEAQTSGIWDEVDNVTGWLQIVKEAVRGVKRRAFL